MKQAAKYCFLPKNKITPRQVDESIDILFDIHSSTKNTPSPLQIWRTLFKYDKFYTPSSTEKQYTVYSFPGEEYCYLSFATSIEKFQVYEQHKTMPIFPMIFSPLQALSYCQNIENVIKSPKNQRIGGFSFNPKTSGGFFTFSWLENNPFVLSLLESVGIELLIRYLMETQFDSVEAMIETLTSNSDFYADIGNLKIPLFMPHLNLFSFNMHAVNLNEQMIAFGGSNQLGYQFDLVDREIPFNELLEISQRDNKMLVLWYEHDEKGQPIIIHPKDAADLSKKISFIQDCNEMLRKSFADQIVVKK